MHVVCPAFIDLLESTEMTGSQAGVEGLSMSMLTLLDCSTRDWQSCSTVLAGIAIPARVFYFQLPNLLNDQM
jgi:hypothetical protein